MTTGWLRRAVLAGKGMPSVPDSIHSSTESVAVTTAPPGVEGKGRAAGWSLYIQEQPEGRGTARVEEVYCLHYLQILKISAFVFAPPQLL